MKTRQKSLVSAGMSGDSRAVSLKTGLDFPEAKVAKALIITEKPSVAKDIVAALGGFTARAGGAYWESDTYLCSFAVGHIFTLFEPEDIDRAYKSWKISLLPILPKDFQLKPINGHEKRIKILQELIDRPDVNCLINACDAAREGELIFREIVGYLDAKQWVRRLWLQSMTPEAIRSGFGRLRDGTDLDGLGAAAECRARSDWLIGMNATRAFSERLRSRGERTPWSVGRVQTPTLALLVERELQIRGHRSQPFFKLITTFDAGSHTYEGTWFDPGFKANELAPDRKDDRIFDRSKAEALVANLEGAKAAASETRDESLRHAPYLFNLTGLQKYMAQRYKWSSKRTLEAAQRCYEGHKVLTYPRTSSQCLPEDYRAEVERLIRTLSNQDDYGEAAEYLLANGRRNDKRTFNNAGVSDHFAIIPTGKFKSLSGDDAKVFDAVVRRFLATFFPPAVYDRVRRITVAAGESFRTGPVETLSVPGWLSVYDRSAEENPTKSLPPLRPSQKVSDNIPVGITNRNLKEDITKPPSRINEAGLLSLMEHAGRQIDNEELQAALNGAEGLGTAATRADIIQNLKIKEYVDESLRPTCKGIHLIQTLHRLKVMRLTSPELTARLELELAEVEEGKRQQAAFMAEINRYTAEVVDAAKRLDWQQLYPDRDPLGPCPVCNAEKNNGPSSSAPQVYERQLYYACASVTGPDTGCGLRLWKNVSSRYLDRNTSELLVNKGRTPELDGFKTKAGKDYRAALELRGSKVAIVDGDEISGDVSEAKSAEGGEYKGQRQSAQARPSIATCPVHGKECQVLETRGAYVCATRLAAFAGGDKNPSGLMLPRILCKRELTPTEVSGMLTTGTSSELRGFISKSGRPFSAKLKLTQEGGFAFEFAERLPQSDERQRPKFPRRRAGAKGPKAARTERGL